MLLRVTADLILGPIVDRAAAVIFCEMKTPICFLSYLFLRMCNQFTQFKISTNKILYKTMVMIICSFDTN